MAGNELAANHRQQMESNPVKQLPVNNKISYEGEIDNYFNNFTSESFFKPFSKRAEYRNWLYDKIERNFNKDMYKDWKNWQTEMSNTEFSRRIKDIEKTGYNPALALFNESLQSAGTPSGGPNKWTHRTKAADEKRTTTGDLVKDVIKIAAMIALFK